MKLAWTIGALSVTLGMSACAMESYDDQIDDFGRSTNENKTDDTNDDDDDDGETGSRLKPRPLPPPEFGDDDDPSSPTDADAGTQDAEPPPPPADPGSVDDLDNFAKLTLSRALQWVDVKMPYCGGVNHGTDWLCGGTCKRYGKHASPEWDPYRTDCSGFVSWSWKLPPPGRVTREFAPLNNAVTTVINVDDLRPGDALNNDGHIILFGGWANTARTKARLLEEYDCGQVAVDRIRNISKTSNTQVNVPGSGTFWAIRLDTRP